MNRRDATAQIRSLQKLFYRRVTASLLLFTIAILFVTASCSVPNLEKPQCSEARDAVKRFYSFHFGNEMRPSPENLKARESFLTGELIATLRASNEQQEDYFTATAAYPKAFRIGSCSLDSNDMAIMQVLLFWRDDTKSEQREVKVETVKTGDKWLINKIVK